LQKTIPWGEFDTTDKNNEQGNKQGIKIDERDVFQRKNVFFFLAALLLLLLDFSFLFKVCFNFRLVIFVVFCLCPCSFFSSCFLLFSFLNFLLRFFPEKPPSAFVSSYPSFNSKKTNRTRQKFIKTN